MSVLHKEYIVFNKTIRLTQSRKTSLRKSRKELRKSIKKWFDENKPQEIQPQFGSQGSMQMNTTTNPIVLYDEENNPIRQYDLDDGIYFIERDGEDTKRAIDTWHDWVYQAVENYTSQKPIRKTTCIRVVFSDGRHIDLPIYYKQKDVIELAHRSKGWLISDPKKFYEWFNGEKSLQLERLVRYFKAWKNYKEHNNASLKLPSGFELTILATNNYFISDNDDEAFRGTVRKIVSTLNKPNGFKCLRPTVPKNEDVFATYSETKKTKFLEALNGLLKSLDDADSQNNFKKASVIIRDRVFGERFPLGEDKDQQVKSKLLEKSISTSIITPKPYAY